MLEKYGLAFGNLSVLNEHGIIISNYNSWWGIQASIGLSLGDNTTVQMPFHFHGRYWVLNATVQRDPGKEFRLHGVALTKSGQELMKIVDLVSADQYVSDLTKYFDSNNLNMTAVASWQLQVMSRRSP